jgi:hypothetical protein
MWVGLYGMNFSDMGFINSTILIHYHVHRCNGLHLMTSSFMTFEQM